MLQFNDQFADAYRSTLKSGLSLMNVCLDGVGRIRDYQVGAVEKMRAGHGEMSKGIDSLRSLEDLQKAHLEMARSQMSGFVSYLGGLYALCSQYQSEMCSNAQAKAHAVAEEIDHTLESSSAAAAPILSAIKLAAGAAESTYAATARVTDDMAQLAASRMPPPARHGNGKAKHAAA